MARKKFSMRVSALPKVRRKRGTLKLKKSKARKVATLY